MKKIIAAILMIMLLALNGCSFLYGEQVYRCSPKNRLGFRSANIRGEHITLNFDEDYALRESDFLTLKEVFESGEFPSEWNFYLIMDAGGYEVPVSDTITVDPENMRISFDKSGATADNVRGFSISSEDDTWAFYFDHGVIKETHMVDGTEYFVEQRHDAKDDFWYQAETFERS